MIILINAEKACDRIQHSFMTKSLIIVGMEGIYLNLMKVMYDKPTPGNAFNDEKLKAFPVRSEKTQMITCTAFI